jgi:hypothetical protein
MFSSRIETEFKIFKFFLNIFDRAWTCVRFLVYERRKVKKGQNGVVVVVSFLPPSWSPMEDSLDTT